MKINVQTVHFSADQKLIAYLENKMNRLSKYFNQIIDADVYLKTEDTGGKIKEKIVEIRLHLPGLVVLDKKTALTFESAINATVDSLKRQVVKRKEKIEDKLR